MHPLYLCSTREPCTLSYEKQASPAQRGWVRGCRYLDQVDCRSLVSASSVADGYILGWLAMQQPLTWQKFPQVGQAGLQIRLVCFLGFMLVISRLGMRCDEQPQALR